MKKLLIIDDSKLTRERIISILQKENYLFSTANSGLDALQILKRNPFDLIITDIIMPEMEGLELIVNIKKQYPSIKIIAVSSYKPFYLEIAKEIGADAICEKRHVTQDLLNITRNLLKN